MAYFAPYIDETGFHCPTYQDILEDQIQQARGIYGQDIYLKSDSQDYQYISTFALKMNDAMQAIQLVYNSRGPGTAIGSGLDIVVKLNGITRDPTTYSTCPVTLIGTPNTPINNGVVQDTSNYYWNLPASIMIGASGTVIATATCQNPGPIAANPGEISIIATPTYGWATVTNASAAIPGIAVETDSQLKARQAISTAKPSLTVLEGTKGAIAAVSDVTRLKVYENDTGSTDANGLPAHSITAVVEGGLDTEVAKAIFEKKGPGCYTNGTTHVSVTDQFGESLVIGFFRPSYVDIDVVVDVRMLADYTSQMATDIKTAIAAFLNGLPMGVNDIPVNNFYGPALSVQNLSSPTFSVTSITAARRGELQGTADITTLFNEALRGDVAYITVNVS